MRIATPPGVRHASAWREGGVARVVYALLALLYAALSHQLLSTVGEPYRTAVAQNARIEAIRLLSRGVRQREVLALQSGLTAAAEIDTFNQTLFQNARALLRDVRKRQEAITAAADR
jgi:hypothetical protein